MTVCLLLAALVLWLPGLAQALEGGPEPEAQEQTGGICDLSLDELLQVKALRVYGVSRYEQSALEAPAQVTLVSAEDIRRYDYRFLSDLLKGQAGLYVTDDRNYRYLGYRGFSRPGDYNTRVLIMIDGVRLNDEVYHQAPIGFDFPLDLRLVDRVEIIRGPSQAIYGNNAFLLVINVITRTPPAAPQVEGEAFADTRGFTTARVTAGTPVDGSGDAALVSGSYFRTPGSDLFLPAFNAPSTNDGVATGCDYAHGGSAFFKFNHSRFSLLGGYLQNRKGFPTGAWGTTYNDSGNYTDDQRFFADLSFLALEGPNGTLKLRSYLNGYNYDGSYRYPDSTVLLDHSNAVTVGGEVVGNVVLPWQQILSAGVDYRRSLAARQYDTTGFRDNRTVSEFGAFIQDDYRPIDQLILTGSLRYDYLGHGLESVSPKAAVVFLPTDGVALKYLFGRSFRAPNAYERYYASMGSLPNPRLSEEVMYSHELVAEYHQDGRLRMALTGFHYDYRDLITQFLDDQGNSSYSNSGSFETWGVESEISATRQPWSGSFSHTFQRTSASSGGEVPNSPSHLLKLALSREFLHRLVIVSGELQYTSRIATLDPAQHAPGCLLLNLSLLRRDLWFTGLDVSLSVFNLLNRRYTQPGGYEHLPTALIPQEGISAGLRISYRF